MTLGRAERAGLQHSRWGKPSPGELKLLHSSGNGAEVNNLDRKPSPTGAELMHWGSISLKQGCYAYCDLW